ADVGPLVNYLFRSRGVKPTEIGSFKENIEDFMTSIEQEIESLKSKMSSGETLSQEESEQVISAATAFNNMAFIFANVINEAQNGPSFTAYHELLKFCSPNDTFITFNWDTLLDRALADTGCWSPNNGYGFTFGSIFDGSWKPEMDSTGVFETNLKLLKLHGSTNWLTPTINIHPFTLELTSMIPDEGDKFFLYWQSSLPYETYRGRWCGGYTETCYGYYPPSLPFTAFSEESLAAPPGHVFIKMATVSIYSPFKEPQNKALPSTPLLITPVRQKQYDRYASAIENVWKQSEDALATTDRIVIIGYSFPVTDIKPMEMLQSTLASRKGEISIEIIDPYAKDIAERIGAEHLSNAKNVKIHSLTFEGYLDELWDHAPQTIMEATSKYEEMQKWIAKVLMMAEASPYFHGGD
ncbi:MAG: hypothetical protein HGA22_13205, partial [Clostridiales bacterium]|nr:hypothetical protein [Clostridiales bacterium]